MAPTKQRGEQVSLDWYRCPSSDCDGVIAFGGLVCLKCGGLLIFASKHGGTPYVPAYPPISATLTGAFAPAPAVPVPPKPPTGRSVNQMVGMLRNSSVYARRSIEAHGGMMLTDIWKNHWNDVMREAHRSFEIASDREREPASATIGLFCDGKICETWHGTTRKH